MMEGEVCPDETISASTVRTLAVRSPNPAPYGHERGFQSPDLACSSIIRLSLRFICVMSDDDSV